MANVNYDQFEVMEVSRAEQFMHDHWKKIAVFAAVIVVICGAVIGWNAYTESKNNAALNSEEYAEANFLFDAQQYQAALDSYEAVIANYGSTPAGNISKAKAGLCQKALGNNAEAISYLEDYSGNDNIIAPAIISALGDCYVATDDFSAAAKQFEKAASLAANAEFSPLFLKKAGLCYEKMGDNSKALKAYETIKAQYPGSDIAASIEKYIIRVK